LGDEQSFIEKQNDKKYELNNVPKYREEEEEKIEYSGGNHNNDGGTQERKK